MLLTLLPSHSSNGVAWAGVASSSRGLDQSSTPFKFVRVLSALGRPDAALAVLRARAPVSQAGRLSCSQAFEEAQTALAVRLQCGVFTEACSEVWALGTSSCCSSCMVCMSGNVDFKVCKVLDLGQRCLVGK